MWEEEEAAMQKNRTLNIDMCRRRGVSESCLSEWQSGVRLDGHEDAAHFDLDDYQSVKYWMERAAEEIDRLTSAGKIFWLQEDNVPNDLDVCPSSLIVRSAHAAGTRLDSSWD